MCRDGGIYIVGLKPDSLGGAMTKSTTELAEWLDRHGLGQYAANFRENNIEFPSFRI